MRLFVFKLLALSYLTSAFGESLSTEPQTEAEALFLRRIADFWEEGEYQIVKEQIEGFLRAYPESAFTQTLNATLGDLYVREKNFQGALMQYAQISNPEIADRTFQSRMQCLLELQWFSTLTDECAAYITREDLDPAKKGRVTYLLAISLYQQCLNTPHHPETRKALAERALPYFKTLFQTSEVEGELSNEIAPAYAHLCSLIKDFPSAAAIYLELGERPGQNREAMYFQAAFFQIEYDKKVAAETFQKVADMKGERSQEALYNSLVLTFDSGEYEKLLAQRESFLDGIPEARHLSARLFFGRSFLEVKKYPEALHELLAYAEGTQDRSEMLRAALIDILDASYQLGDDKTLELALLRFAEFYPEDSELPKGFLGHANLLKKKGALKEARLELSMIQERFPAIAEKENVLFEQLHLEFQDQEWAACRLLCLQYLEPKKENDSLASFVWRFFTISSLQCPHSKEEMISDLELCLSENKDLSLPERSLWTFQLAKVHYELKQYDVALSLLEPMLTQKQFQEHANAHLLFALAVRDSQGDFDRFCKMGETALLLHADLLPEASLHIALFNGYLAVKKEDAIDQAASHLYLAVEQGGAVQSDHLLWLADYYYGRYSTHRISAERGRKVLEELILKEGLDVTHLEETALSFLPALVKLAELEGALGNEDRQVSLLENLKRERDTHPDWAWTEESQMDYLLAEQYAKRDRKKEAILLFDRIVERHPTVRTFISAKAALQGARLRVQLGDKAVLAQLKTLILQKTLANEPIHLEAAIEYIDLQAELEDSGHATEKRLVLLQKTKAEFESSDDLLSQDYQNSRKTLVDKDRIYRAYLEFLEAEIFLCQGLLEGSSEHLENAKKMFRKIAIDSPTAYLLDRVSRELEQLEHSKP
jgi:hypothetical protein